MPYKRYTRRKRSYRRKGNGFKKRMYKRKSGRYNAKADAGYFEKINFSGEYTVDVAANHAWLNAHWFGNGNSGAHDVYLYD